MTEAADGVQDRVDAIRTHAIPQRQPHKSGPLPILSPAGLPLNVQNAGRRVPYGAAHSETARRCQRCANTLSLRPVLRSYAVGLRRGESCGDIPPARVADVACPAARVPPARHDIAARVSAALPLADPPARTVPAGMRQPCRSAETRNQCRARCTCRSHHEKTGCDWCPSRG